MTLLPLHLVVNLQVFLQLIFVVVFPQDMVLVFAMLNDNKRITRKLINIFL